MHPIERLRYVARAQGAEPSVLVWEAARALMSVAGDDPVALVTGCRRLVERHPTVGPMWWLAARVLVSPEPFVEARLASDELEADTTPRVLADALPEDATVTVVGWPEQSADAFRRRGDLELLVVDTATPFARRRGWGDDDDEADIAVVPLAGAAAAVAESDVVVLEAAALGPTGLVAPAGAHAIAAVGRTSGTPVWAVAGVGRVLPGRLWDALRSNLVDDEPWLATTEEVPLHVLDCVVGPSGLSPAADAPRRADCPIAPELLKRA